MELLHSLLSDVVILVEFDMTEPFFLDYSTRKNISRVVKISKSQRKLSYTLLSYCTVTLLILSITESFLNWVGGEFQISNLMLWLKNKEILYQIDKENIFMRRNIFRSRDSLKLWLGVSVIFSQISRSISRHFTSKASQKLSAKM